VEGSGRAAPVPMPEEPLRELREGLEAR